MNNLIKIETKENGQRLVSARELYNKLEVTERFANWFERYVIKYGFVENIDFTGCKVIVKANRHGGEQKIKDYMISLDVAKHICLKQKYNEYVGKVMKYLGFDVKQLHTTTRFEDSFMNDLKEVLNVLGFELELQKKCLNYKIDGYISDLKIAIEYDENHHKYRKYEDEEREKEISKQLNCTFVRCDYLKTNTYNIGVVMKEVMLKSGC